MKQIIPDELKLIAKSEGFNSINYIANKDGWDVFSLGQTDDTGAYLPIGLPILYACKGSQIKELSDEEASTILSNVKE